MPSTRNRQHPWRLAIHSKLSRTIYLSAKPDDRWAMGANRTFNYFEYEGYAAFFQLPARQANSNTMETYFRLRFVGCGVLVVEACLPFPVVQTLGSCIRTTPLEPFPKIHVSLVQVL